MSRLLSKQFHLKASVASEVIPSAIFEHRIEPLPFNFQKSPSTSAGHTGVEKSRVQSFAYLSCGSNVEQFSVVCLVAVLSECGSIGLQCKVDCRKSGLEHLSACRWLMKNSVGETRSLHHITCCQCDTGRVNMIRIWLTRLKGQYARNMMENQLRLSIPYLL